VSLAFCAFFALDRVGRVERARRSSLRFGRVNLEMPVDVQDATASSGALMTNVSSDGAFIETPRAFPVGERVTLRLALAGYGEPLAVTAEVRWHRPVESPDGRVRPAGCGLRFVALRSGVSIRLARLLDQRGVR
jgi:uncharacterized protein (TIGR02266 family)